jgi:3-keto-5-aminohexanoate cleavage enzyme
MIKNNKIFINLAPNGMVPKKNDNPNVPINPDEIVDQVLTCSDYGLSMVHIHARDSKEEPTSDKKVFSKIFKKIRKYNRDIIIVATTSGRVKVDFKSRSEVLDLKGEAKPDMASLTMSSLNFIQQASMNSPKMIVSLIEKMNKNKILPEIEIFDLGMLNYTNYLIKKKILKPPFYINIILGNIASAQADFATVSNFLNNVPNGAIVSLGGIGKSQYKAHLISIANIGLRGVRVGIEDNLRDQKNNYLSNIEEVKKINSICKILDINIVKPKELRKILKLSN